MLKYLGVMFDSNLAGKYYTQSICHKMRKEKQLKTTTTTTKTWVLQLSADSTLCPASCFTFSIQVINHLLFNLWNLQLGILCREVSKEDLNSRALSLICYSTSKEHTVAFFVKSNCLPILNLFFSEILAIYFMDQLLYRKPSIYKSPYRYLETRKYIRLKVPRPKYKHPSIACIEMNQAFYDVLKL